MAQPEPNESGPQQSSPPPGRDFRRRLLIVLAVVGAIALAVKWYLAPAPLRPADLPRALYAALVLGWFLVALAASQRRLSAMARDLAIWQGIILLLVLGYGYRWEIREIGDRLSATLNPSRAVVGEPNVLRFRRGEDQQFRIDAVVNRETVRFVLDTGASMVMLTRADARRLGFEPDRLAYSQVFETANGTTHGATVVLEHMAIGPLSFDNVTASVNEGDLSESLLGMRLIERLGRIEIGGDEMVIRK